MTSVDLLLRPLLTRYKIPHVPSMFAFFTTVGELLACVKKVDAMESDSQIAWDGAPETTTRLDVANAKVKVLTTDLAKQKRDVARLKTELTNEKNRNADLDRELKSTQKDLTTAHKNAKEASKSVFAIKG